MKKKPWWCSIVMATGDPTQMFINSEKQKANGELERVLPHLNLPERRRFRMYLRHVPVNNGKVNHVILLHVGPFPPHLNNWKSEEYPWIPAGTVTSSEAKERIIVYARML